jgi:adenylyl-sulfate kinase
MPSSHGHVFWLCGLSGAGKSTLADALAAGLRESGIAVLALDGDALRAGVCRGLGFSAADRAENLRRAAEVARLAADSGLCTVASFITPLHANRQMVDAILGPTGWSLVYLDAPLDVCRQRDVKGLYAGANQGRVADMTGLASPFEPPAAAALVIPTAAESPAASSARLLQFARARLAAGPA